VANESCLFEGRAETSDCALSFKSIHGVFSKVGAAKPKTELCISENTSTVNLRRLRRRC